VKEVDLTMCTWTRQHIGIFRAGLLGHTPKGGRPPALAYPRNNRWKHMNVPSNTKLAAPPAGTDRWQFWINIGS